MTQLGQILRDVAAAADEIGEEVRTVKRLLGPKRGPRIAPGPKRGPRIAPAIPDSQHQEPDGWRSVGGGVFIRRTP